MGYRFHAPWAGGCTQQNTELNTPGYATRAISAHDRGHAEHELLRSTVGGDCSGAGARVGQPTDAEVLENCAITPYGCGLS